MNIRPCFVLAAATALVCTAALAQSHLRPGLWEEQVSIKTDDAQANAAMAQMKEKLASMPPDQRAMIEKMMAGHGMGMGGAPSSVRVCMTKEQVERDFTPDNSGRCQRTHVNRSGNVIKFDFTCTSSQRDVSGQGTLTLMGDSAFAMSSAADTVTQNKTMHIQTDIAGKFVSGDCGDVKPIETPPAK